MSLRPLNDRVLVKPTEPVSLRPLNDRVLVKPHKNPDVTESGLVLPENRSEQYLEMQGTVVAVGRMTHPRKDEAEHLAVVAECNGLSDEFRENIPALLRDLVRREPLVQPGDDVLFSWTSGHEVTIDDERLLILKEDDLLAVLESA